MILPIPIILAPKINIPTVPFYSQFKDIHMASWQKVSCGIASLAMIIDYYSDDTISVDMFLKEGISAGAYDKNNGWIHTGLISLAKKYNLIGVSYDLASLGGDLALAKLKVYLNDGPVMASIHYKFNPKSKIPHLVVIDGIKDDIVYYNDPAGKSGENKISIADFQKGWKKRVIVLRPIKDKTIT